MIKKSVILLSVAVPIGIAFFFLLFYQPSSTIRKNLDEKQRGAHIFGYLDSANVRPFIKNNIEWITIVPFSIQDNYDSPEVRYFRGDSSHLAKRDSMWRAQIEIAHSNGFKVFLKPHLWIHTPSPGKWRSDVFPTSDENWVTWKKSYREFILLYANIATENNVEMFCIGTEFSRLTMEKTEYWSELIKEIRTIYPGKLTYAANWYEEYEKITFWNELDYIGVQAYFPLTKTLNPTTAEISEGWNSFLPTLQSISKKYNKKILFTEMGYKSSSNSTIEPWTWVEDASTDTTMLSNETQANAYQAFFNTVWNHEWFAGVHIWQMRPDFETRRFNKMDFTPQGKPAEEIIRNGFK